MNVLQEEQEKEWELQKLCREILGNARNELYLSMRFLDVALSALAFTADGQIQGIGTDGLHLYYHPRALTEMYRRGRNTMNHTYLHIVLHCLFGHMFVRKEREEHLWNLACDITVEYIIDGLYQKCVHLPKSPLRRECYRQLEKEKRTVTAQRVYQFLSQMKEKPEKIGALEQEFWKDDHSRWGELETKKKQEQQNRWEDIREKLQTEMETFSKEAAEDSNSLLEQVQVENRERYDYKEFLRKFAVLREEMQVDMDTFDYIFYHYGLETYGNMPLIEPLETTEVHRVEDFVIVIDTSMSCKGELVQHFLEETYSVLREVENAFHKINLHILQCDEKIQEDRVIRNREEMEAYMKNFTIKGQGGTDFRPPFAYVEELKSQGMFGRLKGLIYFTDGYGTFPAKMPPYETAFVFMEKDYRDVDVPPWAIKLIITEEELQES